MERPEDIIRPNRLLSVSSSLRALAVAFLILVVLATAQQLLCMRMAIVENTENQMARLDMVFAEQTRLAVAAVDGVMISALDALRDPNVTISQDAFDDLLRRRVTALHQVSAMLIVDAQGRVIRTSLRSATVPPQAMAMLAAFQAGAAGPLFSAPFRTADNTWTAMIARPMTDASGITGIAVAMLNLNYFEDFYRAVELPENGAIILHQRDGTVLARFPHVDAAIGTSFANLPPFKDVLSKQQAGTLLMESPIDGSIRVTAIRALRSYPLAVMVSVDQGKLLTGWRRQAWVVTLAAILLSLFTVALLLRLSQRSRQVERLLAESRSAAVAAEETNLQLRDQMAERERAEAALRQAQRMEAIGQLTGGVAHDFNNLLTVLQGNIEIIERNETLSEKSRDRLAAMRQAAHRGATLTGHLLAFARRQPLLPRPVNLNTIVLGMRGLLDGVLRGRVDVVLDLDDGLWVAMVDPTQIELVILNLAINACDAMEGGGTLTIATGNRVLGPPEQPEAPASGAYVMVSVRDTGTGMTPEVRSRVFEPFFTTKPPGAGSGLGLSQVVGTARQSGGGVTIDTAAGVGSTIAVYLPRAAHSADQQPLSGPGETARGAAATVLLVDDDDAVRAVSRAMLRELGYDVREAASGAMALRLLEEPERIDLLLTDLVMPSMTGAQLAHAARARRPALPVVFISGYAGAEALAGPSMPSRLLRKPVRLTELREQIEAALAPISVG